MDLDEPSAEQVATWLLLSRRGNCRGSETEKQQVFVRTVCAGYFPNPYHNLHHAVDVMHAVWRCGELMPWGQVYQKEEQHGLVAAALAHDIGHFGLNNVFLVDMRDELAIRYNDISPLENMHCSKLFLILAADRTNVLSHLAPQDYRFVRKLIIDAILHTDPVHHGAMVKDLTALLTNNAQAITASQADKLSEEAVEIFSSSENKTLIGRLLLHGADLSNPAKPWDVTFAWAQAVVSEFFAQGDQEKALGLPVGMLNDRTKVSLPNSQLGFIQFMVAPFVAAYVKIFRNWRALASMLASNTEEWSRLHFAETGKDESAKVKAVRDCLQIDVATELADGGPKKIEEHVQSADGLCTKDKLPSGFALAQPQNSENLASTPENEKRRSVVREVRRWREYQDAPNSEKGQHRELVLLYMLSDGEMIAADGKDLIMKFNAHNSHFGEPNPNPRAQQPPNESNVVTVSVAADNTRSQLDRDSFDHLLSSLLEKRVRY